MTSQLSWQPPPVTKCGECPCVEMATKSCYVDGYAAESPVSLRRFQQNKDGITPTCPMWQQQKASLDANKKVKNG